MFQQDHLGGCIESRLMKEKVEPERPQKVATAVIQLREDSIFSKMATVEFVKMVTFWIYFKVKANIIFWQILYGK